MGASKRIRKILKDKGIQLVDFAVMMGENKRPFYNKMQRDTLHFSTVEKYLDALNCEIVFRDKETKKEY